MNVRKPSIHLTLLLTPVAALLISLAIAGCGGGESTQDEQMFSQTAMLQYRIDSLTAENRRLMQQIDALSSENRSLTARSADLEMQLKEAQTPPPAPVITDMSAAYTAALGQYRKRDFAGAMQQFEQLLGNNIQEDLADNCHYWIGECLYGMGQYGDAIHHFETAKGMAHSEKKDDSQLMIGNSYAAMGNKAAARDAYNALISSYPASPYLKKAQEKLGRLG